MSDEVTPTSVQESTALLAQLKAEVRRRWQDCGYTGQIACYERRGNPDWDDPKDPWESRDWCETCLVTAVLAHSEARRRQLEHERDELLLDRHQPDRLSPCGHYRVFAMPCVQEDGSETPSCMQCDRDRAQTNAEASEARRQEVESQRDEWRQRFTEVKEARDRQYAKWAIDKQRAESLEAQRLTLEARLVQMESVLRAIANANPHTWEEDVRDQFQPWAQNIARAALSPSSPVGENR